MTPVLNSYFVQHKNLSIPGLGTIWIDWEPASRSLEKDRWLPPAPVYRFDKFHDTPGKDFFHFIAERKKIPEHEAMKWYNELTAAFRSDVRTKEEVRWEGICIFKKGASGEITIEPVDHPFSLFAPVEVAAIIRTTVAEPVIIQEEAVEPVALPEEEQLSPAEAKRDWWIFAGVLFVVILLLLFIHFYLKGLVWQSLFNQQPVF